MGACHNKGSATYITKGRTGGGIPAVIQSKVDKVRQMTKNSAYGELQGDIKVTKDKNGNYNLSYTQVKSYDTLKSSTIGVDDIPARKETTYTTYVMNEDGKRIDTIRKTSTEYSKVKSRKTENSNVSNDWNGTNANRGISRKEIRRRKAAQKWAEHNLK